MNCNDQILACLPSGCSCVKYDPVTGQLAIDGNLVKLYMQSASVATAETLQGTVLNPAIEVGASAITGLCAAIGPCMAALPPGSIDVSALQPGAEGTVLQSLGGAAKWSGLDDKAIQKAFGDSPPPQPPIDGSELAKVYGEDSQQKLTAIPPKGVFEAAMQTMPLQNNSAPLRRISGTDAGGMGTTADIIRNGVETVGSNNAVVPKTLLSVLDLVNVTVPADGVYAIAIDAVVYREVAAPIAYTSNLPIILTTSFLLFKPGGLLYHSGNDTPITMSQGDAWPAGTFVGEALRIGQVATAWLKAGDLLELKLFDASRGGKLNAYTTDTPRRIILTALGPMQIAP